MLPDPDTLPLVQWIIVVVQIVTLVAVIVYVWKTWEMAAATKRASEVSTDTLQELQSARLQATAPKVLVYFQIEDPFLAILAIENIGETTAEDVRLTFDPPLQSSHGADSLKFIDSPKVLPPKHRLTHAFDTWPQYYEKEFPLGYIVTVKYRRSDTGESVGTSHVLDAEGFRYRYAFERKGLHELAKTMEGIRELIKRGEEALLKHLTDDGRIRELDPRPLVLEQEVAAIGVLWNLFKELQKHPRAHAHDETYFSLMRHHLVAALRASDLGAHPPQVTQALTEAFVAFSDYRVVFGVGG